MYLYSTVSFNCSKVCQFEHLIRIVLLKKNLNKPKQTKKQHPKTQQQQQQQQQNQQLKKPKK